MSVLFLSNERPLFLFDFERDPLIAVEIDAGFDTVWIFDTEKLFSNFCETFYSPLTFP